MIKQRIYSPRHSDYFLVMQVISLPYPYGSCKAEHDDPADTGAPYTISSCRIECETTMVYQGCGCRLVESPNTSLPLCDHTQYNCALSVMSRCCCYILIFSTLIREIQGVQDNQHFSHQC